MISINGHIIKSLPFDGLTRISNLIEFEGPILAHYTDKYNNHYLYYWVDNDETYNRWLIWKVKEDCLYLYLARELSLYQLFPISGEFVYIADIDSYANYSQIALVYSDTVPENYIPEQTAFYNFELPEVYNEQIQTKNYLESLKQKALYFNVEPSSGRYGVTVSINDVWNVLSNLGKSFTEYVDYNVQGILKERFADFNRILKTSKSLSSNSRLRVVYLNLNSFHVGIAADSLNNDEQTMDKSIDNFKSGVLASFQNEILDNDFSSSEDINILVKKYPDEETRKKIFDPLIKIINNDNIKVNITDYTKKFNKKYTRISEIEKKILVPNKPIGSLEKNNTDQALMIAYVVADKSPGQQTLFPKDITSRILFSKETNRFPFEIDRIAFSSGEEILFKYIIEIEGTFDHGLFILEYPPLGIMLSVANKNQLHGKFVEEFIKLYTNFRFGNDQTYAKVFNDLV